jgi:NTP pyrophosphatase (non-canonical NTP hydrolase)
MFNQAIEQLQRDWDTLINEADIETAPNNKAGMLAVASQLNDSIAFLKNAQIGGFGALVALVRQWGVDKGLTGPTGKATVLGQIKKLEEEFEELKEGIEKNDQHEVVDAVGDMTVVLILLSELAGFKFETALRAAYDVIKNRTGRMAADGTFVKDKP